MTHSIDPRRTTDDDDGSHRRGRTSRAVSRQHEEAEHARRAWDASQRTDALQRRVAALTAVLADTPRHLPEPRIARELAGARVRPFDPAELGVPLPAPQWSSYAPPAPGLIFGRIGRGRRQYESVVARATAAYEEAVARHRAAERRRLDTLAARRAAYAAKAGARLATHNAEARRIRAGFRSGDARAVGEYVTAKLGLSGFPANVPVERRVSYRPHHRELLATVELPDPEVVPVLRGHRYVKSRGETEELARPAWERADIYRALVCRIVLRTIAEAFTVAGPHLADAVVLTAVARTRHPASGRPVEPCLAAVLARRGVFTSLDLADEPETLMAALGARVSRAPYELVPIPPAFTVESAG